MIQNLITKKDKDDIKLGYRKRFVITLAWSVLGTSLVSCVLLLPPFIMSYYRVESISHKNETGESSSLKLNEVLSGAALVNSKSKTVVSLQSIPDIVGRVENIYNEKSSGILVNYIFYDTLPNPTMKLGGIAKDRASLLTFQKAIQGLDFVKAANIPVSNFAKDVDLPFLIDILINK